MSDQGTREAPPEPPPVDESSYAASSAESGGNYSSDGPTAANPEGDTRGTAEEELAEEEDGA